MEVYIFLFLIGILGLSIIVEPDQKVVYLSILIGASLIYSMLFADAEIAPSVVLGVILISCAAVTNRYAYRGTVTGIGLIALTFLRQAELITSAEVILTALALLIILTGHKVYEIMVLKEK